MMGSLDAVDVGLGWIEFPWMNVEGIAPLLLENPAYTHLENRIRDQPEIAASSPRQVLVHHGEAREHHLIETLLQFKDRVVLHLQVGELSVTIVGHRWKKAGVVSKTWTRRSPASPAWSPISSSHPSAPRWPRSEGNGESIRSSNWNGSDQVDDRVSSADGDGFFHR